MAGSSGYWNYRHQANVCHAYQTLKRGGLKDEHVIVFMYDDIAYNEENPRQGVIINNPHSHGEDVYEGVPKFRKAPQSSSRKFKLKKELAEAMAHWTHSVKLIGKLLFGIHNGHEVLKTVFDLLDSLLWMTRIALDHWYESLRVTAVQFTLPVLYETHALNCQYLQCRRDRITDDRGIVPNLLQLPL